MPKYWTITIARVVLALLAGVVVGWLYDNVVTGLLIAVTGLLGWHLYHLYRLDHWLRTKKFDDFPVGAGIWPEIFARVSFFRTRSRRRGKRLRAVFKEFRLSTAAFPDAAIILNSDDEVVYFNKAARKLLGFKKHRDRGQRIQNLIRLPLFIEYFRSEKYKNPIEFALPPGGEIWVSCRIVPYGPGQRLVFLQNVTQNKRVESMRRDFVANASHELRTPLTVISGYLDILSYEESLPERYVKHIDHMQSQVERMRVLLDDLLQMSQLETSDSISQPNIVNIDRLMAAARQVALAMETGPGTIEIHSTSGRQILGEQSSLQSIVSNLVNNAAQHTPADGRIDISWSVNKKGGKLTIKDTGTGISPENLPRITERFFRVDEGRCRDQGGTGLGLAIVKHALKRHDAELIIESEPGKGSTFTCLFPPERLA